MTTITVIAYDIKKGMSTVEASNVLKHAVEKEWTLVRTRLGWRSQIQSMVFTAESKATTTVQGNLHEVSRDA